MQFILKQFIVGHYLGIQKAYEISVPSNLWTPFILIVQLGK